MLFIGTSEGGDSGAGGGLLVRTLGRREFVGENVGDRGENPGLFASEKVKKGGFVGGLGRKFGKFDYCRGSFLYIITKSEKKASTNLETFPKSLAFLFFILYNEFGNISKMLKTVFLVTKNT